MGSPRFSQLVSAAMKISSMLSRVRVRCACLPVAAVGAAALFGAASAQATTARWPASACESARLLH